MLAEAEYGARVGQQDRGVEDKGLVPPRRLRGGAVRGPLGATGAGVGAGRRTTNRGHFDSLCTAHTAVSLLADEMPGPIHHQPVEPIPALRPELKSLHVVGLPERTTGALRHVRG